MPNFTEFPYYVRPDLSPYLLHLTKADPDTGLTAKERLIRILQDGVIRGSSPKTGSIKGDEPAVCFMDVPFAALKQVLSRPNLDAEDTSRTDSSSRSSSLIEKALGRPSIFLGMRPSG